MNLKRGVVILSLFCMVWLSLQMGVRSASFSQMIAFIQGHTTYMTQIIGARLPRTLMAFVAGPAIALATIQIQAMSHNPLAEPSLLGINAGSSLLVVLGLLLGFQGPIDRIVLALAGALIIGVVIMLIADSQTPVLLVLAGAAISVALRSIVAALSLTSQYVMDQFRFWQVGAIVKANFQDIALVTPFLLVGLVLAMLMMPALDQLRMGDELAQSLGVNRVKTRLLSMASVVLLVGSITAICGPITFLGLWACHLAKRLSPSLAQQSIWAMMLAASFLLGCDIVGRLLGELEVGVVTALIGGPLFMWLIRR